jgi:hypothetical protein
MSKVREPVQAYLDSADATLLEELAERLSSSKAEVIRQAIRRLAQELDLESRPWAGILGLKGALDSVASALSSDLAQRHDEYLYGDPEAPAAHGR